MNLDRVTITGADDSVSPHALAGLAADFPFVEFGILASATKSVGEPRYPTLAWMDTFRELAMSKRLRASLHLCGRWTRLLMIGEIEPIVLQLANGFGRIQLNFRPDKTPCEPSKAMKALDRVRRCSVFGRDLEFIFQLEGVHGNDRLEDIAVDYVNAYGEPCNMVGLFDMSGGAGRLPGKWPAPMYHNEGVFDYHGYAGGLGPDNLAEQLPLIGEAAGETRIWVDMETKVRSDNDRQFDLAKVRRCLEICKPFVKGGQP
jgi:hypothetical protein